MNAVILSDVTVVLGGRTVLTKVNWGVARGACAAVLGPNGCGKSTLLRVISGYQYPTAGHVSVLGETFGEANLSQLRERIRLVQPPNFYDIEPDLSVRDAILTGFYGTLGLFRTPTHKMIARANVLLGQLGLAHLAERLYATLSTGERTRTLIARAIVEPVELLLLDEPTTGLDLPSREAVLRTVETLSQSEHAPTIIMTTHHVEELPVGTSEVLLLDSGHVAASGQTRKVLRDEILSRIYQTQVQVHEQGGRFYLHVKRA